MEKQTSKSKIYNMFNGRELTQDCDGNWYLTELYPSPSIPIDSVLCDEIVHIYNYLEEDSGNSFTGEIHYTLQDTMNYTQTKDLCVSTFHRLLQRERLTAFLFKVRNWSLNPDILYIILTSSPFCLFFMSLTSHKLKTCVFYVPSYKSRKHTI